MSAALHRLRIIFFPSLAALMWLCVTLTVESLACLPVRAGIRQATQNDSQRELTAKVLTVREPEFCSRCASLDKKSGSA